MNDHVGLRRRLEAMRAALEKAALADTAAPGTPLVASGRLDGHCAVVALLLHDLIGGEFVSANVSGLSHWFNRILNDGVWIDVDLTGDQFYGDKVRVGDPGKLWEGTRARSQFDINGETMRRYAVFRSRFTAVPW